MGKTLPGRRYCWRLSRYQKNVKIYEEIQDERLPACQGERSSFGIKVRKAICITSQMRWLYYIQELLSPKWHTQAVGLIYSHPDVIFDHLMSLDKSRTTWDSEFIDGWVVERVFEFDELVEIKMKNPVSTFFLDLPNPFRQINSLIYSSPYKIFGSNEVGSETEMEDLPSHSPMS